MRRLLIVLWLLLPTLAGAEEVVLGLSSDQVSINTSFNGGEILVFGAVKREKPIPDGPPLQVVITVAGPSAPVTVRRKARRFGIWINTEAVNVDIAPSFYAVATSGPLHEVVSNTEDMRYKISIDRAIRSVGAPPAIKDSGAFTEALIRVRGKEGLYQLLENRVAVDQQTLFRTAIDMPANLTEGTYGVRIFLTRAGKVISRYETRIDVRKVGLERWLFTMSRQNPLWYGLMSLAIAIAAGWGASAAFRLVRDG